MAFLHPTVCDVCRRDTPLVRPRDRRDPGGAHGIQRTVSHRLGAAVGGYRPGEAGWGRRVEGGMDPRKDEFQRLECVDDRWILELKWFLGFLESCPFGRRLALEALDGLWFEAKDLESLFLLGTTSNDA